MIILDNNKKNIVSSYDSIKFFIPNNNFRMSDDLYVYNIVDSEKKTIFVQTPFLLCPFAPHFITYANSKMYYFHTSFYNYNNDVLVQKFQAFITNIENKFSKWIDKKINTNFLWNYSFQGNHDEMSWKLTTKDIEKILIYDSEKNRIFIKDILPDQYIRFIVEIVNIWYRPKNQTAGLNYRIIQIQLSKTPYPNECIFENVQQQIPIIEPKQETPIIEQQEIIKQIPDDEQLQNFPLFAKYFKMLSVKIPKEAIKQKMIMNGLDPSIIELEPTGPIPQQYTHTVAKDDILQQSLNDGVELKQCVQQEKKIQKNGFAISLDEILKRIGSLKRINFSW